VGVESQLDDRLYDAIVRIVRQAIEAGVREALDDLRLQQTARPRFVTLAQAARIYGIAPRTLRQYIRSGRLRGYSPGRTKLLIEVEELEAFVRTAAVDRERDIDAIAEQAIAEMEVTKQ